MASFTNVDNILKAVMKLLSIPKPPDPPIPLPVILASGIRPGLSAQKMAAEVIRRREEAGLPVGNLPDGSTNPAEQLEFIRMQVIIDALATDARVSVVMKPGVALAATGTDATGTPVTVVGVTTAPGSGNAIIQ